MHKHLNALVCFLSVIFVAVFVTVLDANADDVPSWLSSNLTLQKEADTQSLPLALNGNIDCAQESSTCSVSTRYGTATPNSTVRLNATGDFYPVFSYIENRQRFLPILNSSTAITYTTEPSYGFYLYFNYNFSSSITKTFVSGIGTSYQINHAPDGKLVDKSNRRLAADYNSMSFSENGQWMVVSHPNVAMLRVNLQTFEAVPFAPGFNYTIGLDPAPKTAITNDGRYAAVASKNFDRFMLYDLNTCASVPDTINGPVACQSRDLGTFMKQQVPGYQFVAQARFLNNDMLAVYASYKDGAVSKTARFLISISNITSQIDYLALGDSYISGEGAFNYQSGTDSEDNRCHLSLVSYPYLIGHDLNNNSYYSVYSVACSGAVTQDITDVSIPNGTKIPQAEGKEIKEFDDEIYANFLPGYRAQINFVSSYRPKIINLTIGGNDIGFSDIVTKCAAFWNTDNCYESYEDRLELIRLINSKFPNLVEAYTKIKNQAPTDSRIYIIGYPQIAKPNGSCALNVRLSDEEAHFSELIIEYLNTVIKAASDRVGVYYVDTKDALFGHRLCEAEPGSLAMNGLTAGTDAPVLFGGLLRGPIGNESYHPNELGHQLLENKILAATNNLTKPMPLPNPNAAPPPENGLEILAAPRQNRDVYAVQYNDNMSDDILFRESASELNIQGLDYSLAPGGSYRAELHSDILNLGTFSTDSSGNLSSEIQIPGDVPIGFHTLHIYGSNLAGGNINVYKNVYVAASEDDYDGDGIENNIDPCFFIESSGQDYDQDGTDDACDGIINQSPAPSQNSSPPEQTDNVSPDPIVNTSIDLTSNASQQPSSATTVLATNLQAAALPIDGIGSIGNLTLSEVLPAITEVPPVSTDQDGEQPLFELKNFKQQWPAITVIFLSSITTLGILWKKGFHA